jgi:ABC-type branched-subunit amino acid transport system substrate-binding protein
MKKFETEYGKRPSAANVITGYAAIQAIKLAAERAKSTEPDAMKAEFEKFKNEEFLVGATTFDEKTHINYNRPMLIMQVQDGKHSALNMVMPERIPGR